MSNEKEHAPKLEWSPIHSTGLETWTTGAHRDYQGRTYYWYGVISHVVQSNRVFLLTSCFAGSKTTRHASIRAAQRAARRRLHEFRTTCPPPLKK